jgi:hypothetical protein
MMFFLCVLVLLGLFFPPFGYLLLILLCFFIDFGESGFALFFILFIILAI